MDDAGAKEKLAGLTDVTHIFYAGLSGGVEAENVEGNLALVTNSVGVIEPISPTLERVLLVQGGKYYGVHLGPHKTPSKETDPRHLPPNFYYNQQDFIADLQQGKSWNYTILRAGGGGRLCRGHPPQHRLARRGLRVRVQGHGRAAQLSGAGGGVYRLQQVRRCQAARPLRRLGRGQPRLRRRGVQRDQRLGHALVQPVAGLHRVFRLPAGRGDADEARRLHGGQGPRLGTRSRATTSSRRWLTPTSAIGGFADWNFGRTWDTILEDTKRLQYGFTEAIDTEQNFIEIFDDMRAARVIPAG